MQLPSLLWTCSQIQNEAYGPWIATNSFFVRIAQCDDQVLQAFMVKAKQYNITPRPTIGIIGALHWGNLLAWCRNVWEGKSSMYRHHNKLNMMRTAISAAHHIAKRYRAEPWEECEAALEAMKARSYELGMKWIDERR